MGASRGWRAVKFDSCNNEIIRSYTVFVIIPRSVCLKIVVVVIVAARLKNFFTENVFYRFYNYCYVNSLWYFRLCLLSQCHFDYLVYSCHSTFSGCRIGLLSRHWLWYKSIVRLACYENSDLAYCYVILL